MNKTTKQLTFLLLLAGLFTSESCRRQGTASETGSGDTLMQHQADSNREAAIEAADSFLSEEDDKPVCELNGITVRYFMESAAYADAELTMEKPQANATLPAGKTMFKYNVKNYELSKPTPGAEECHCNNSAQGQHIHHIVNNEPYIARYTDTFSYNFKPGRYINLAFLSRSYHESIKNGKAYHLTQFVVGGAKDAPVDLTKPMLFYSRPKGEYKGEDTKNILLDFFLANTDLSETGNKVRVTINDNTPFTITRWTSYSMTGLPMGKNTIKLELIDKDGKVIPGPYNTVQRTITLVQ